MYNIKVSSTDMTTLLAALNHYTLDLKDDPIRKQVAAMNLNIGEQVLQQSESVLAFERAIKAGLLSNEENAPNFAGDYMYMGVSVNKEYTYRMQFKHRMTRQYLHINV